MLPGKVIETELRHGSISQAEATATRADELTSAPTEHEDSQFDTKIND
jgi:hypothetical protein